MSISLFLALAAPVQLPETAPLDATRIALYSPDGLEGAARRLAAFGFDAGELEAWPIPGWSLWHVPHGLARPAGIAELVPALSGGPEGVFAAPVLLDAAGGPFWPTPDLLIGRAPGADARAADRHLARLFPAAEIEHDWAAMSALRVRGAARDGIAALELAQELEQLGATYAEPDWILTGRAAGVPSDAGFSSQWALHNVGQAGGALDADVDALEAWTITSGHPSVHVAVLDVGVDPSHYDLMQVAGADFTGEGGAGAPVNGCDHHGTAVAGCVSAAVGNGVGVAGLAPAARVASARVLIALPACDGSWTGQASWTVDALAWAEAQGMRVTLNANSYAVPSAAIAQKYADTRAAGLLHFASAGDAGLGALDWPASLPDVNAVAALDRQGQLAAFSNHGPGLWMAAPGAEILTTDRLGGAGYAGGDFATLDGSSFAAAYAAAAAALVLAADGKLTAAGVEQALEQGAVDLGPPGPDDLTGHGFLNADGALRAAGAAATTRVHVGTQGQQADTDAYFPSLSADGRYVAFDSTATTLVAGDTNGFIDGYVHDRLTGRTERISISSAGVQGDDVSGDCDLSGDARCVAFDSSTTNLIASDTNGVVDVFVRDRLTGLTTRASVASGGAQASGHSFAPSISIDGRYVAFRSKALDLAPGENNVWDDVFVHDRATLTTVRGSVSSAGVEGNHVSNEPEISWDGRTLAFHSRASNLVPADLNGVDDVFARDLLLGTTELLSVSTLGVAGNGGSINPGISANGRWVVFQTEADNLDGLDTNGASDICVRDRAAGTTVRISVSSLGALANGPSTLPSNSPDGRYVAFYSEASNLVAGDTNAMMDAFVHDLVTGATTRVSVDSAGGQITGPTSGGTLCGLSWDGRFVTFEHLQAGLVPGDTNGVMDLFVRDQRSAAPWDDVGAGLGGSGGTPRLEAQGGLAPHTTSAFRLSSAPPATFGAHVFGATALYLSIFGGVLVPSLDVVQPFATSPFGTALFAFTWAPGIPAGLQVHAQSWMLDASAAQGFAASNALSAKAF